jgi:UDP-N-acetylglucosamine acyltransferase
MDKPNRVGKYNILSEVGRGATAVVYLGEDEFNDRKVAIKVAIGDEHMSPDEAKRFHKLFLNEASLVGKLSHPNIVGVFDAVVEGDTTVGDGTQIFPFGSIGLAPQDLKYRGERTRLVIGRGNIFRESVTIHRGTVGGGSETRIGDRNLFMAYAHVAHDCRVGSDTIFGPGATLGGHVEVGDFAQISAYSGVHQFCRVGRYAFIGGYSVVTKDALPYAKTVGNRARVYGLNTIGLVRKGFSTDVVRQLRQAYRFLLTSRLTPSKALAAIEGDPRLSSSEVAALVAFIRSSTRGVTLRRPNKRAGEDDDE